MLFTILRFLQKYVKELIREKSSLYIRLLIVKKFVISRFDCSLECWKMASINWLLAGWISNFQLRCSLSLLTLQKSGKTTFYSSVKTLLSLPCLVTIDKIYLLRDSSSYFCSVHLIYPLFYWYLSFGKSSSFRIFYGKIDGCS